MQNVVYGQNGTNTVIGELISLPGGKGNTHSNCAKREYYTTNGNGTPTHHVEYTCGIPPAQTPRIPDKSLLGEYQFRGNGGAPGIYAAGANHNGSPGQPGYVKIEW